MAKKTQTLLALWIVMWAIFFYLKLFQPMFHFYEFVSLFTEKEFKSISVKSFLEARILLFNLESRWCLKMWVWSHFSWILFHNPFVIFNFVIFNLTLEARILLFNLESRWCPKMGAWSHFSWILFHNLFVIFTWNFSFVHQCFLGFIWRWKDLYLWHLWIHFRSSRTLQISTFGF